MSETDETEIWLLRHKRDLIATLEVYDMDFPWRMCRVNPSPAFESFRAIFVHPEKQGNLTTRDTILAARKHCELEGITLTPENGNPVREFSLFIDGDSGVFQFV